MKKRELSDIKDRSFIIIVNTAPPAGFHTADLL